METWRKVWRTAVVPLLSTDALVALQNGLATDDPCLQHGATTKPPSLFCAQKHPCDGACLLGYCGWKNGLKTVGEVEGFFGSICEQIGEKLGEPTGCNHLLNWFDETPRAEMRRQMLPEVALALAERYAAPSVAAV